MPKRNKNNNSYMAGPPTRASTRNIQTY